LLYDAFVALLSIRDLCIRFGPADGAVARPAVDHLNLTIEPGQALGLVGESGSGKSVTSLAILRLLDETAAHVSGSIRFDEQELLQLAPERMRRLRGREIAMIFQEPMTALNPVMPVGEQIAEGIRAHHPRMSRKELRETVLAAMDAVALPDAARRYRNYPHQFSGGQRQRILIAMAIANRPRLLIADEPTTALDVTVQAQILDLLADLRKQFGLAMLFISHDLAVVSQVADRVAVMRHGVLLEEASRREIFEHPLHPYTRGLIGAVPTMETPRGQPLATLAPGIAGSGDWREARPAHWLRG
jgi:peptide/nickel transport system ATP-binding protein